MLDVALRFVAAILDAVLAVIVAYADVQERLFRMRIAVDLAERYVATLTRVGQADQAVAN